MAAPKFSTPKLMSRRAKIVGALDHMRNKFMERVNFEEVAVRVVDQLYVNRERTVFDSSTADSEEFQEISERLMLTELYERRRAAVDSLLKPYTGRRLDAGTIKALGIHVAGWWDNLRAGEEWALWDGVSEVWSSVYVSDMHRLPIPKQRLYKTTFKAYAGRIAGLTWDSIMPGGYSQAIQHDIAYRYERYEDEDLSGLWFTALVHAADSKIAFKDICLSSSQAKDNRKTATARKKICRGAFPPLRGHFCEVCPVGRQVCPRARSSEGYNLEGLCRAGHTGFFRNDKDEYCHMCMTGGKYKRPKHK